jgi:2-polyprenyl-6-methoxyphenol hydroxylase-like FAD-dependent oxidoreductase
VSCTRRRRRQPDRRVIVVGGSIAGLIAGNLLHRRGWDVDVYERAVGVLEGRGAGITILPGLIDGLLAAGVEESEESLGIELAGRIALDRAGRIMAEVDFGQWMTSWRRLFEALRAVFPDERYHPGMALERVEPEADRATAWFAGGESAGADVVVGADGLRSTVRSQLLPDLEPHYGGYIAWRCLTDELDLSESTRATLSER